MSVRCVLFSSDPGTVGPIRQALADLGVEGEHCSEAVAAVEKVCKEAFQIVIVDWDKQPEAGALLAATRERKVTERPLALALISTDAAIPKALQAGATSILRKPIQLKQVTDSLRQARDLLRARESAAQAAAAGVGSAPVPKSPASLPSNDVSLRSGEFLQSSAPATQFETESELQKSLEQAAAQGVDALKDLEPMAAAVKTETVAPPAPLPAPDEPRGLQWYLNKRAGVTSAAAPGLATTAAPAPAPAVSDKPELLGFDQTPSFTGKLPGLTNVPEKSGDLAHEDAPEPEQEKKTAELFAYIAGEGAGESKEPSQSEHPRMRLGKGAILFALALAACAVVAAPQAPWHPQLQKLWVHEQQALHAWLNPQVNAPAQAPVSHENFGRAGDEYKLPVAESIPDATTDPSQIRVTPMVDPTAKKPNNGAGSDPNLAPTDAGTANPGDVVQNPGAPVSGNQVPNNQPSGNSGQAAASQDNPASGNSSSGSPASGNLAQTATSQPGNALPPAGTNTVSPSAAPGPSSESSSSPAVPNTTQPAPPRNSQPHSVQPSPSIPSSLKSQMASMTPDASGNKAPEAALPSIEPVDVPEATERGLVTDQPAPAYPDSAKGQQGSVVLQVLIGRDGTVQDAKFLQGSLAFARAAIDGVKSWKFKPYLMNGRPVSVQTSLTISFRPAQ
jgi:TonB family protein